MPRSSPDAALRRLVSRLAGLHAEDVAAILDELDGRERPIVERLLRKHAAYFGELNPTEVAPDPIDTASLSPWLAERIRGQDPKVTEATRNALRDANGKRSLNAAPGHPVPVSGRNGP